MLQLFTRSFRRRITAVAVLAGLLAVTCVTGCDDKQSKDQASTFEEPPGEPTTDEECAAFGEAIANALREGDAGEFNRLVEIETFFLRGESGLSLPPEAKRAFRTGVQRTMASRAGIIGNIAHEAENGGEIRYTKTRTKAGKKSVLLRLSSEKGMNFYEFTVTRRPKGNVVAADFYDYLAGESFSDGVRRGMLVTQGAVNKSLIDRITGKDSEIIRHADDLKKIIDARGRGDAAEALRIIENLPESLRNEKFIFVHWVACAQEASDKEYLSVLEQFRKHFPNDPAIDFVSVDAHYLRGEYKEALECIDRFNKAVGGDPYVKTLKANIHLQQADYAEVRKASEEAIKDGDARPDAFFPLIVASLRELKHEETLEQLKRLSQKCDLWLTDFAGNPEYANFIESPQHAQWQEYVAEWAQKKQEEP